MGAAPGASDATGEGDAGRESATYGATAVEVTDLRCLRDLARRPEGWDVKNGLSEGTAAGGGGGRERSEDGRGRGREEERSAARLLEFELFGVLPRGLIIGSEVVDDEKTSSTEGTCC
jgi:hypothetical protein